MNEQEISVPTVSPLDGFTVPSAATTMLPPFVIAVEPSTHARYVEWLGLYPDGSVNAVDPSAPVLQ